MSEQSSAKDGEAKPAPAAKADPSGVQLVHGLAEKEGVVEAPTDIAIEGTKLLRLPDLTWKNYGNPPNKLVITNTGHTVNVGGKWESNRSYLRDGPFKGQYVFAQMHFHWGPGDDTGSEHSVDGVKLPMELHVVHINRIYRTQELALKENDGVAILIYLFQLQEQNNSDLTPIVEALPMVTLPQTSTTIDPMAIEKLIVPFQKDYFLYWGAVSSPTCKHRILWLTCRTPLGISSDQLAHFRQIRDVSGQFMVKNFRETHPRKSYTLFHVNPSSKVESTLLAPFPGHALAGSGRPSEAEDGSRRVSGEAGRKRGSGEQGAAGERPRGDSGGEHFEAAPTDDGYKSLEGTVLQESSQQDGLSLDRVGSGALGEDGEAEGGAALECKASHAESICMEDVDEQHRRKFSLDIQDGGLERVSERASALERASGLGGSGIDIHIVAPDGLDTQVDGYEPTTAPTKDSIPTGAGGSAVVPGGYATTGERGSAAGVQPGGPSPSGERPSAASAQPGGPSPVGKRPSTASAQPHGTSPRASATATVPGGASQAGERSSAAGAKTEGPSPVGGGASATATVPGGPSPVGGRASATATVPGGPSPAGGRASATSTVPGGPGPVGGRASATATVPGGPGPAGGRASATSTVPGGPSPAGGRASATSTVPGGPGPVGGRASATATVPGTASPAGERASAAGAQPGGSVPAGASSSVTASAPGATPASRPSAAAAVPTGPGAEAAKSSTGVAVSGGPAGASPSAATTVPGGPAASRPSAGSTLPGGTGPAAASPSAGAVGPGGAGKATTPGSPNAAERQSAVGAGRPSATAMAGGPSAAGPSANMAAGAGGPSPAAPTPGTGGYGPEVATGGPSAAAFVDGVVKGAESLLAEAGSGVAGSGGVNEMAEVGGSGFGSAFEGSADPTAAFEGGADLDAAMGPSAGLGTAVEAGALPGVPGTNGAANVGGASQGGPDSGASFAGADPTATLDEGAGVGAAFEGGADLNTIEGAPGVSEAKPGEAEPGGDGTAAAKRSTIAPGSEGVPGDVQPGETPLGGSNLEGVGAGSVVGGPITGGGVMEGAEGVGEQEGGGQGGGGHSGEQGGEYGGGGGGGGAGGLGGEGGEIGGGQGGELGGAGGGQDGGEDGDEGGGRGWADATGDPELDEERPEDQEAIDGGQPAGQSASQAGGQMGSGRLSARGSTPAAAVAASTTAAAAASTTASTTAADAATASTTAATEAAAAAGTGSHKGSVDGGECLSEKGSKSSKKSTKSRTESAAGEAWADAEGPPGIIEGDEAVEAMEQELGAAPLTGEASAAGERADGAPPGAAGAGGQGAGAQGGEAGEGGGYPGQELPPPPPPPYQFQYFKPELEEQRGPQPVFFNSMAVTPAVLHSKHSLNEMKPAAPCHGRALKIYEDEKLIWLEQEADRQYVELEALKYCDLVDEEWDSIAYDVAQLRKEARPPDAEVTGTGWPFDPFQSDNPDAQLLSPIDVSPQGLAEVKLSPLVYDGHFNPNALSRISNTGETVEVRLLNPHLTPTLHGGPLPDHYIFDSMHFHWGSGSSDSLGSVHRVGGQRFCMEVHLLHYRAEYGCKAEALRHQGGLCVVAFMLHMSSIENAFFSRLARDLTKIEKPMSCRPIEHNAMLCCAEAAAPFGYVTYPGTLIGREDNLNVVWIVYPNPVGICCQNTMQFQQLRAATDLVPGGVLATHEVSDRPVLKAVPP